MKRQQWEVMLGIWTNCFLLRMQVLVVANPANTNALILKENAPSIPAEDITCLTRLDHNRALGQVRRPALHAGSPMAAHAVIRTVPSPPSQHCLHMR